MYTEYFISAVRTCSKTSSYLHNYPPTIPIHNYYCSWCLLHTFATTRQRLHPRLICRKCNLRDQRRRSKANNPFSHLMNWKALQQTWILVLSSSPLMMQWGAALSYRSNVRASKALFDALFIWNVLKRLWVEFLNWSCW